MEIGRIHSKCHKTLLLTMMMFKWGIFCSESSDRCLSEPCQNGATCVDMMDDYVCICPRGAEPPLYMGKDCDQPYDGCVFADCPECTSTPGTRQFHCACPRGFAGPNCTFNIDDCESAPCEGAGPQTVCVDGIDAHFCICPAGLTGDNCEAEVQDCSAEPCLNNGTCTARPDGFRCDCPPGFRGDRCEEDVDECLSRPCRNGAICLDGPGRYRCFCVPGFQGYNCEIDINECASHPCENNATCVNEKDRYICECLLGYSGVNCEVEIDECDSGPCQNGATCHDWVGQYTCECPPGFEGMDCEINIDECASGPCLNEGTCVDLVDGYECDCSDTGFTGEHCEEDIPECASNPCLNGATCVEGWEFYAYAAGYLCQCQPGYTGENCSLDIDECGSAPCQNGGSCEDQINAYACTCMPGFTGVDCEVNVDECESAPCQNGGLCEDNVAGYTCVCPDPESQGEILPWGGRHCEVRLTGCLGHACQNGATCRPWVGEDGRHGSDCLCPPGFYGEFCGTPTTFSFSVPGFVLLELPLANRSRRSVESGDVSVSLRLRTTLPDMLVFLRGDANNFLSLEVVGGGLLARAVWEGGALEARFMELVSDGTWLDVSMVTAEGAGLALVLKGGAGCDGDGCRVEEGVGIMTFDPAPGSMTRMFVGGVPEDYFDIMKSRSGFIGCVEDLMVDGRPVLPQDLPPDQTQDVQMGCSKTEWCHPDPCSGQGRCVDLWTHYKCDCHRPFHGDSCAQEYPSWTYGHEGAESFSAFDVPAYHGSNFSVSLFLRTLQQDGLLFQLRRQGAPYLSLFLRMGRVLAAVDPETPPATAPVFVADGEKRLVEVEFQHGQVFFRHDGMRYPLGALSEVGVEPGDLVFLGGLPEADDADLQAWGGHFKGCLQDVRLAGARLDLDSWNSSLEEAEEEGYLPSDAQNVELGCLSDDTCQVEPCQNGGECTVTWNDFVCSCLVQFTGRTCETRVWCFSDPCVMGGRCRDLPDGYECLSNATFGSDALRFKAEGSLVAPVTSVSMELRTRTAEGVVLRAELGAELFSVGLQNSSLLVRVRQANSVEALSFASRRPVADGSWHRVRVSMVDAPHQGAGSTPSSFSSPWVITVDGWSEGTSHVPFSSLDFLGSAPVLVAEEFVGCLGNVRVGGIYLPFVDDGQPPQPFRFIRVDEGKDVQLGCMGHPVCLSQPCQNEGTCMDLFNQLSCSCAPGWEGPFCEHDTDDCASQPCLRGVCADLLAGFRCDCPKGYVGDRCEVDVDDCEGHACQNGATCLDGVDLYTCVCPPDFTGPLCQWPYPPLRCEEDVQCENGGVCRDELWGANCTCRPGYAGDRCEVEADECASNPCRNGGTCLDRFNRFQCVCSPGFIGRQCENSKWEQRDRIPWLVVAVPLGCCCVLLAVIGLIVMVMTARKKRQSEGTYSPSQQEVAGARLEMDSMLKVPPEERLI
ncbi:hypothetical protein JZ751_016697 [Albula glossodonta]|uniref:Uncharacterized protein n=1 Tax=Albula glossodonta TaxID=121402 RepID=A0A8T2NPA8_9TELE|nr:hypothetical protein JZ751_016697 [Albula glossodonta]